MLAGKTAENTNVWRPITSEMLLPKLQHLMYYVSTMCREKDNLAIALLGRRLSLDPKNELIEIMADCKLFAAKTKHLNQKSLSGVVWVKSD